MAKERQQKEYNGEICDAKHKTLEIKIEDNTKELNRIEKDLKKTKEDLKNEISTTKLSISNNLDKVDLTLRGNGKIGLQETTRSHSKHIKVIYACLILLFGFKLFGAYLDDVVKELLPKSDNKNVEIKKIEENVEKINIKDTESGKIVSINER